MCRRMIITPRLSCRIFIAVVIPLTLFALMPAFPAYGQLHMRPVFAPFELSASQGIDREKGSVIIINAALDYRRLVFFKKAGHYESRFRVYVDLGKGGGSGASGEVWEETITVPTYRETRAPSHRALIKKIFPVEPGDYKVKVVIEVIGTSRKYKREMKIRIVGGENGGIQIATPVFFTPGRSREADKPLGGELAFSICSFPSDNGFNPVPGAIYLEFDSWLRMHAGIIAPVENSLARSVIVSIRVIDFKGRIVSYNRKNPAVSETGELGFCVDMNVDHLPIGFYKMEVSVEIPGTDTRTSREEPFVILLNRGLLYEHFPKLISLLSIIADEEELLPLKEAQAGEREEQWHRFWNTRERDSSSPVNQGLSEFLRRMKYSLRAFSKTRPGWETDRGRILIKNGNPDRIQDRSGSQYDLASSYQVWYYNSLGLAYIFQNTMGGGEYRLVDTQMY